MNIKKLFALILAMLILSSFSIIAFAEEYSYDYMVTNLDAEMSTAHKYDYVYDFADLFTDDEELALSAVAKSESEVYGFAINFLTYDDSYGEDVVTFTDDFYDYYITQLDFNNEVDGVMIVIDMEESVDIRQVYINTVGTVEDNVSDSEIDVILDDTYTYAQDGDYYNCLYYTLNGVISAYDTVHGDEGEPPYYQPTTAQKIVPTITSLIVSVVLTAVVVITLLSIHNKQNKAPSGQTYQTSFNVANRNAIFMGHREEVIPGFYKQQSSSGGGGGGSSHMSGGGGHHGGGGHGF